MQSIFTWKILSSLKPLKMNKIEFNFLRHFKYSKRQKEAKQKDTKINNYQAMQHHQGILIFYTVYRKQVQKRIN